VPGFSNLGIDAPLEPAAQAQVDHAFQPIPVAREEIVDRLLFALGGAMKQRGIFARVTGHDKAHTILNAIPVRSTSSGGLFSQNPRVMNSWAITTGPISHPIDSKYPMW
jgi:hypothetical protein